MSKRFLALVLVLSFSLSLATVLVAMPCPFIGFEGAYRSSCIARDACGWWMYCQFEGCLDKFCTGWPQCDNTGWAQECTDAEFACDSYYGWSNCLCGVCEPIE